MIVTAHPGVAAILERFKGAFVVDVRFQPDVPLNEVETVAGDVKQRSLGSMRETLEAEAWRIRFTQGALVAAGDLVAPIARELERANDFEAAALLIDRCKADPVIMEHLKKGRAA